MSNVSSSDMGYLYNVTCNRLFGGGLRNRSFAITKTFISASLVIGSIDCIAALPTIIVNVTLILAIIRTHSLHTTTNFILTNFLLLGALTGFFSLPIYGSLVILLGKGRFLCDLSFFTGTIGGSIMFISVLTIAFLSYERHVAIFDTYDYNSKITKNKIVVIQIFFWVISFTMFILLQIEVLTMICVVIITIVALLAFIFTVIVHIKMFLQVRRIQKQQAQLQIGDAAATDQAQRQEKERRLFKFAASVILFQGVCLLPSVIYNGAFINQSGSITSKSSNQIFKASTESILLLEATFSPYIFAWQSPSIRRAVLRVLQCKATNQVVSMD